MRGFNRYGWSVAAALALAPLSGTAGTIDFRTGTFAGADGAPSFSATVDGVTASLAPDPAGAHLYWDSTDGIGVRWSYETDEIENDERLTLSFSSPIHIQEIMLTDLFNEHGYLETGWYELDGGPATGFTADADQLLGITNGVKLISLDRQVSSIRFGAPGMIGPAEGHEFSIGRVKFGAAAPVPEPASGLLLSAGGLLIGWAVRRR
jgi:hypothetical protein